MQDQMTYDEAVELLSSSLKFGIDASLDPIRAMCLCMENPQGAYKCVQIAGTNGKSSTSRMIAALLHGEGYRVGLYTSPHLVKYPERIEVNGKMVSDQLFAQGISVARSAANQANVQATEFELLTAAAFWIFAHENVDWAVLECGLGGRWDATSVVTPDTAVITGIALDHTRVLGDTVEAIAAEKAAIIKPGCKAVLAQSLVARDVFEARAREMNSAVFVADEALPDDVIHSLNHMPEYQFRNAMTALAAARVALEHDVNVANACEALSRLVVPGRFETLRTDPLLIIDAAHNPQSAQMLASEIAQRFITAGTSEYVMENTQQIPGSPMPTLLIGVLADKDARGIVRALCPLFTRIVATASSSPRSIAAQELARIIEEETAIVPVIAPTIADAKRMLAREPVIATGSITVAGEVKAIW